MVQAARSGVQNIAEGSMASGTSKKTELKLTGVARASLEELLLDYEDYLRQHGLRQWSKDSCEAKDVRDRFRSAGDGDAYNIRTVDAGTAANTMICLINQASFLLGRQMRKLEQSFINEGGFTERLWQVRNQTKRKKV